MTNLQRRLLLVEDEMLMSALLADSLKNANFAVETAADAAAARKAIKTFDPDIMLIDIFLGSGPNGIQLANAVSKTNPEIGLLILTKYQDSLSSANDLGQLPENCGFLRKDMVSDTSYLVNAMRCSLIGRPKCAKTWQ
jgi:DNA-binding NtrC family response regulator